MKIEELQIEVDDAGDYEYEASEILTQFCEELEAQGYTYPDTEHDEWWKEETGIHFLWKQEASAMIENKLDELYAIGKKYFPKYKHLDISSHMYRKP